MMAFTCCYTPNRKAYRGVTACVQWALAEPRFCLGDSTDKYCWYCLQNRDPQSSHHKQRVNLQQ